MTEENDNEQEENDNEQEQEETNQEQTQQEQTNQETTSSSSTSSSSSSTDSSKYSFNFEDYDITKAVKTTVSSGIYLGTNKSSTSTFPAKTETDINAKMNALFEEYSREKILSKYSYTSKTGKQAAKEAAKAKLQQTTQKALNKKKEIPGNFTSEYLKTYTSYSGHDMVCTAEMPLPNGGSVFQRIGELQTISYSIHNEKMPVRVLGNMNMLGTVFGSRTIAGSMIFIVFNKHWCTELTTDYLKAIGATDSHVLMDELPGMNITISMANEYGFESRLVLYGVTFVNEGQVMSTNDMYTENTYQFLAEDIDYLIDTQVVQIKPYEEESKKKTGSSSSGSSEMDKYLDKKYKTGTATIAKKWLKIDSSESKMSEFKTYEDYKKYCKGIYDSNCVTIQIEVNNETITAASRDSKYNDALHEYYQALKQWQVHIANGN